MKRNEIKGRTTIKSKRLTRQQLKDYSAILQEFLRSRRESRCRQGTLEHYESHLGRLEEWLIATDQSLSALDDDSITEFIGWMLDDKELAVSTCNMTLRATKCLLRWIEASSGIEMPMISVVKGDNKRPRPFSDAECAQLVKPLAKDATFSAYRDYVMALFLFGTGVRRTTLREVRCGDIDFRAETIRLRHLKQGGEDTLPMSDALAKTLRQYLQVRGGEPEDYLFCNRFGEAMDGHALLERVRNYVRSRGVREHEQVGIHLFRHTFARLHLKNGTPLEVLQRLLGHSSLATTARYVNLLQEDLVKSTAACPLDVLLQTTVKQAIRRESKKIEKIGQ